MRIWPTRRQWRVIFAGAVVLGFAGALFTYDRFFREADPPVFRSDEDHFLFGSIGTEAKEGVPYWIWLVLPRIFPDLLPAPGGYASLGLVSRGAADMPIGLTKVTVGFPRVGINCAFCHTASYRARPDDPPVLVAAGPSHQTAPQAYFRFLFAAAADPRFNASTILGEIAKNYRLPLMDRLLMRAIVPVTRRALLRARDEQDVWMRARPDWGPGRIDGFNPVKFRMLGQPVDSTIGNADMVPVWNMKRREGWAYHWDGLTTSLREVVISSALGDGASTAWVDRDVAKWDAPATASTSSLKRIMDFLLASSAPQYPLAVDAALAARGSAIYQAQCAACHASTGPRAGTIVPVDEVGTDRHRVDAWTKASAAAFNQYGDGHAWDFSAFRSTTGYVPPLHDGLWLRGPYLHNGSVPSLADLLMPPAERPPRFWRGYDVLDGARVGFVSSGPEAERAGVLFDTTDPGNGNGGHTYGTTLSADHKQALLEYLKTL